MDDDDNDTERWVQCALCTKWRCVPDTLLVDPNVRWVCRYNVFSATFNRCDAPQEPMGEDEEEEPLPDTGGGGGDGGGDGGDGGGGGGSAAVPVPMVDAAQEGLFHESQCGCETCRQMNTAAATWAATTAGAAAAVGTPPLVSVVLNAIDETEHIAAQFEDEKMFLYGSDPAAANP
jgi:hypothetical protein